MTPYYILLDISKEGIYTWMEEKMLTINTLKPSILSYFWRQLCEITEIAEK